MPYRPRDFRLRIRRKALRSLNARKRTRHRGRRLAVLAAAIAVPAFAAPSGWDHLPYWQTSSKTAALPTPLGFEQAGESFPGSAFFYLADTPELSTPSAPADADDLAPDAHWDSDPRAPVAARPMMVHGTGNDHARAMQCLAQAIYYEAASESDAGQRAVAQVVLNRVAHPAYPNTVCGVVYQGSYRKTGCQFTFTCDGALARQPSRFGWERARRIAQDMLNGGVYAPIGLATHYHTIEINPYWASSLDPVGTIGAHRFYRWKGKAGQPASFRFAYGGQEPATSQWRQPGTDPLLRDSTLLDPARLEAAYEARLAAAHQATTSTPSPAGSASPSPAPSYAPEIKARGGDNLFVGDRLPGAGTVLPQYSRSGQWLTPAG